MLFLQCFPIEPNLTRPSEECCIGVNPIHAEASFPFLKTPMSQQPSAKYKLYQLHELSDLFYT
jgi:hypothetical protein